MIGFYKMRSDSLICCFEYDTPLGRFRIEATDTALLQVIFVNDKTPLPRNGTIVSETPLINKAYQELTEYFQKKRKRFDLPLSPAGTEFQTRVWTELLNIPYGKTVSYQDIARAIGNEKAVRAVGGANNKNPLPIFIPCHRVIGKNGKLIGYAGGLDIKSKLLELEQNNCKYLEFSDLELNILRSKDKKLCAFMDKNPMPMRELFPDIFSGLVDAIVSQQISTLAKEAIMLRLRGLVDPLTPEGILSYPAEQLAQTGIGKRKAEYIKNAALEIVEGRLDLNSLHAMTDAQVIDRLTKLKGVGRYTAEMLLIFALGREDVFSFDDLCIKKGLMKLYGHKEITAERFAKYKKRFSPLGTLASLYFWEIART